ncbi:MAG: alpha/beta fold hydrolase [Pseudomonadota bacterium]
MKVDDFAIDLPLASGGVLRGARCRYATWGRLNTAKDNLVLYPTRFGGTHEQNAFLIGPGKALDPERYCILVPNMLGNGASSSPSNTSHFPLVTHADNIELQRRLLSARFQDAPIALAVGWSMGAQQSYRWAVEEPDRVVRLLTVCGTARTTPHNRVFLEGVLAALGADPRFGTDASPIAGLRAAGRVYAGWAYSQPWIKRAGYRDPEYAQTYGTFDSLNDWLENYWDKLFTARSADDIAACARTWIANDVADGGDLDASLDRITAKTLVMTATTDLYFTPEDCRAEAEMIPNAMYRDIETDWGHMCGSGQSIADTTLIDDAIAECLAWT